jgi:hypothetical protein
MGKSDKVFVKVKIHQFDDIPSARQSKKYPFDKLEVGQGFEIDRADWQHLTAAQKMVKFNGYVTYYNKARGSLMGKHFVQRIIDERLFVIRVE